MWDLTARVWFLIGRYARKLEKYLATQNTSVSDLYDVKWTNELWTLS